MCASGNFYMFSHTRWKKNIHKSKREMCLHEFIYFCVSSLIIIIFFCMFGVKASALDKVVSLFRSFVLSLIAPFSHRLRNFIKKSWEIIYINAFLSALRTIWVKMLTIHLVSRLTSFSYFFFIIKKFLWWIINFIRCAM